MWTQGTLEQLFQMAESGRKVRREELRELVYVAHGEPEAFLESLRDVVPGTNGMMGLAAHLGDQKTVAKMKRDALARKFLKEANRGR